MSSLKCYLFLGIFVLLLSNVESRNNVEDETSLDLLFKMMGQSQARQKPCVYYWDEDCQSTDYDKKMYPSKYKKMVIDTAAMPAYFTSLSHWQPSPKPTPHNRPTQSLCSCVEEYRLKELGGNYYPRYVTEAVCGSDKSCAGPPFHCRPRTYNVKVLRRREMDDPIDVNEFAAPDSLRENWAVEIVNVTVACECMH